MIYIFLNAKNRSGLMSSCNILILEPQFQNTNINWMHPKIAITNQMNPKQNTP